ncbi:hypothetical protein JM93_03506 [Roseibium hamelinense]|uniref:Uncharacterized protein n=1 Tax=Roseibium hamelinense TaxID=150831 RepID=A0A562SLU1_9HYPH|nr:hypothetical protein [Roseibium hamelinense]TWI82162.1 hypothetical protein JM93_03506 [Roseibium hamelinense]
MPASLVELFSHNFKPISLIEIATFGVFLEHTQGERLPQLHRTVHKNPPYA